MPTTAPRARDTGPAASPADPATTQPAAADRAAASRLTARTRALGAALGAVVLGTVVRAAHVVTADFPLNDGGLFYAMTRELARSGLHLPTFTTYNAARIPFAYSPFGFYVAALLAWVTPGGLIAVFRWLPLVVACLTVAAMLPLARALAPTRTAALAAVVAFAVVPRSFVWLVMGGGLTRGFGLLFTILAVQQAHATFTRRRLRHAVGAGVCVALVALSHLGTLPFVLFSLALVAVAVGRHRFGVRASGLAALVAVALIAPWVVAVARVHGLSPFFAAAGSGQSALASAEALRDTIGALARLGATTSGEPLFPIVVTLALLGGLVSLRRGDWLVPVWWVGTTVLHLRGGQTYGAVPLAVLAGFGFDGALLPLLRRRIGVDRHALRHAPRWWTRHDGLTIAVVGGVVLYGAAAAIVRHPSIGGDAMLLGALTPDQRAAMRWAATTTPPESRFLVVPDNGWAADRISEWFPVLAERVSVATPQGREWLPGDAFARSVDRHRALLACGHEDASCLDRWSRATGIAFAYVFVPRSGSAPCCAALETSLRAAPGYRLVRDGPDAAIYAVR